MSVHYLTNVNLERQMVIIAGILRNAGLGDMKLTLVARHETEPERWIVKTNDDPMEAVRIIHLSEAREVKP